MPESRPYVMYDLSRTWCWCLIVGPCYLISDTLSIESRHRIKDPPSCRLYIYFLSFVKPLFTSCYPLIQERLYSMAQWNMPPLKVYFENMAWLSLHWYPWYLKAFASQYPWDPYSCLPFLVTLVAATFSVNFLPTEHLHICHRSVFVVFVTCQSHGRSCRLRLCCALYCHSYYHVP